MTHDVPRPSASAQPPLGIRWWPAGLGLGLAMAVVGFIQFQGDRPYQQRNLATMVTLLVAAGWLWLWWLGWSRAPKRWRYGGAGVVAVAALAALQKRDELEIHLQGALNVGVPARKLAEAIFQIGVYAGFPAVNAALAALKEVLVSRGEWPLADVG